MHSSHTEPNYRSGSSVTQHLTRNSAQLPGIKGKHLQTVGSTKVLKTPPPVRVPCSPWKNRF